MQLWWVHRTRFNFIVEYTKRFAIIAPDCLYDQVNQKNLPFAWTDATIVGDFYGNHSYWTPLGETFHA